MSSAAPDVQQLIAAYQTLDLELHASELVIRIRYHELAQIHHPDKWSPVSSEQVAAGERMREIDAAYDLIKEAPLQHRQVREEQSGPVEEAPGEARRNRRHWLTDSDLLESSFRGLFGVIVGASFAYWLARGVIQNQLYLWLVPMVIGLVFARGSRSTTRTLEETIWFLRMIGR